MVLRFGSVRVLGAERALPRGRRKNIWNGWDISGWSCDFGARWPGGYVRFIHIHYEMWRFWDQYHAAEVVPLVLRFGSVDQLWAVGTLTRGYMFKVKIDWDISGWSCDFGGGVHGATIYTYIYIYNEMVRFLNQYHAAEVAPLVLRFGWVDQLWAVAALTRWFVLKIKIDWDISGWSCAQAYVYTGPR